MNVKQALVSGAIAVSIFLGLSSEAVARGSDLDGALMTLVLVPPAAPFFIYDIIMAAAGSPPSFRWALAETITTSLPVLVNYAINGYSQAQFSEPVPPFYLLLLGPLSGLPVHGSLALAEVNLRPTELFGVSMAVGFDALFSSGALARAFTGRLSTRWTGVAAMIGAAPQVAAFSYGAAVDEGRRTSWIGLSAWSGAILLHGLVSTIAGGTGYEPPPRTYRPGLRAGTYAAPPRITIATAPSFGKASPAPLIELSGSF